MEHHQLAQLQEKLFNLNKKLFECKRHLKHDQIVAVEAQIRSTKSRIDGLGKRGNLKMVLIVKKLYPEDKTITQTLFYMDLDDNSIYSLLNHQLKNGEYYLSKSIIQIPMGKPIASRLENNILSWQINS